MAQPIRALGFRKGGSFNVDVFIYKMEVNRETQNDCDECAHDKQIYSDSKCVQPNQSLHLTCGNISSVATSIHMPFCAKAVRTCHVISFVMQRLI